MIKILLNQLDSLQNENSEKTPKALPLSEKLQSSHNICKFSVYDIFPELESFQHEKTSKNKKQEKINKTPSNPLLCK